MNKWNYEADEANISWGEEVHDPQALLSHKKIELSNSTSFNLSMI